MKNENDNAPSAAQIAAYRTLWAKLLAPRTSDDGQDNVSPAVSGDLPLTSPSNTKGESDDNE